MTAFQKSLSDVLIWVQFASVIIGIINFKKFKNSYWKWFVFYLALIFLCEAFAKWVMPFCCFAYKTYFYSFFVIPLEFLFLFWIYCYQSLHLKKLFWVSTCVYFITFIPHLFIFESVLEVVYSLPYAMGNLLLLFMVLLEFNKQIKTDNILLFKKNMMFYINTGVMLFYIGTLPFFIFYGYMLKVPVIWNNYYIFCMIANSIMYLFFIAALVWGKPNT